VSARRRHRGEVVGEQQERRALVEAVVVVRLEVLRFGKEGAELLQRDLQTRFQIRRQGPRVLQLDIELDQLHRPVGGRVVVVEGGGI